MSTKTQPELNRNPTTETVGLDFEIADFAAEAREGERIHGMADGVYSISLPTLGSEEST